MSWDYDFAREFKKRDNQEIEGAVIGTVMNRPQKVRPKI